MGECYIIELNEKFFSPIFMKQTPLLDKHLCLLSSKCSFIPRTERSLLIIKPNILAELIT